MAEMSRTEEAMRRQRQQRQQRQQEQNYQAALMNIIYEADLNEALNLSTLDVESKKEEEELKMLQAVMNIEEKGEMEIKRMENFQQLDNITIHDVIRENRTNFPALCFNEKDIVTTDNFTNDDDALVIVMKGSNGKYLKKGQCHLRQSLRGIFESAREVVIQGIEPNENDIKWLHMDDRNERVYLEPNTAIYMSSGSAKAMVCSNYKYFLESGKFKAKLGTVHEMSAMNNSLRDVYVFEPLDGLYDVNGTLVLNPDCDFNVFIPLSPVGGRGGRGGRGRGGLVSRAPAFPRIPRPPTPVPVPVRRSGFPEFGDPVPEIFLPRKGPCDKYGKCTVMFKKKRKSNRKVRKPKRKSQKAKRKSNKKSKRKSRKAKRKSNKKVAKRKSLKVNRKSNSKPKRKSR